MLINPDEPEPNIRLRDGQEVMLLAHFTGCCPAYVGMYRCGESWVLCSWNKDGSYIGAGHPRGLDMLIVDICDDGKDAA
jgi:hypothetical protein